MIQEVLFGIYFFIASLFAFFFPGDLLVKRLTMHILPRIVLAFVVGVVLWALLGLLLGYAGIRWATYVYLFITLLLWLRVNRKEFFVKVHALSLKRIDWLLSVILLLGIFIQLLMVWFIGVQSSNGITFCCFWPDSLYHLSLTNQLVNNIPPIEPGMSGVTVYNYHYLANIVIAEMVRVFHLPLLQTQYHYGVVLFTSLLGLSVIVFARMQHVSASFVRWFVFFIFFSGDIIFLLLLLLGKGFIFEVNVGENATTLWFSPPRVFAMMVFFAGASLVTYWLKKKDLYSGILIGLLFGSLIGFKIYIGIFALCGLLVVTLYFLIKKQYSMVLPLFVAGLVSLALYLPINRNAGGLLFVGLWRIEDFAIKPIFGLLRFEQARMVYQESGNFVKVALIELLYFGLYVFSLCGSFLIGVVQNKKSLSLIDKRLHIFFLSGLAVCAFVGIFFLQQTGGANTLQFLFTIYIVGSLYAALACSYWLQKVTIKQRIVLILVIMMLAGAKVGREVGRIFEKLSSQQDFYSITSDELAGLRYLQNYSAEDAIVVVSPEISKDNACYALSLFSNRQFFLCGQGILMDHGVAIKTRERDLAKIFTSDDAQLVNTTLKKGNISYIYETADQPQRFTNEQYFTTVFENKRVRIHRFSP